jgi:hypothetical protein
MMGVVDMVVILRQDLVVSKPRNLHSTNEISS